MTRHPDHRDDCPTHETGTHPAGARGIAALLGVVVLLLSVASGQAATYYIKPDTGSDLAAGGIGTPWRTFFKVKNTVVAGDTVNILGGTYTNAQYKGEASLPLWTNSHGRGTFGSPITIQANPGETVVLDGQYNSGVYWQLFRATVPGNQDFYIKVQNITFQHFYGAAIGIGVNAIPGNVTRRIIVQNCTFKDFIMNSSGAMGTHFSDQIIFKNNTFYNIGNPTLGAGDGNPDSQHALYISHDSSNIVAEGNYMEKISGFGFHGFLGFQGGPVSNWIIRKNFIVNAWYSGITTQGGTINNSYIYNNTIYSEAVPFSEIAGTTAKAGMNHHGSAGLSNANYKNNIVVGFYSNGVSGAVWSDDNTRFGGTLKMDYNLWLNTALPSQTVYWAGNGYTMAGWKASGFGYDAHSISVSPTFTNAGAAYPNRNLTLLAGSPAIDAGAALTTTVGAGSSSTAVTVGDAGFFHDGFGIGVGDVIRVGNNTVTITGVNYGTNVLTVTPAISWSSGQGVSLPYNGSAPDMGAAEVTTAPPTGTTYYLNPASGLDSNNGLSATGTPPNGPWKTFQKVKTSTGAGDTVNVIGGTYTPSQYQGSSGIPSWSESQSHGTLGKPITIQANPGDTVIFDGAGQSYWMNITGGTATDRHLIIQNLTFQNFGGAVITAYIANYVVVQNCRFLHSGSDGWSLAVGLASHIIFRNNLIDTTGTHGIYFSEGATFSLISNNTVLNVGALGTGPSGASFGMHGWGHYDPAAMQNLILRNNVVANALTGTWTFAGGVYTNIYIYNNTLYQDSSHQTTYGMFSTHNGGTFSHIIVTNNIGDGYATPANVISDPGQTYAGLVLDYNLWRNQAGAPLYSWNGANYTLSQFQSTVGYDLHSQSTNPLFTNPATGDFTLQDTSPAIDAGTFLTTTTSAGSGTVVPVADAGFFSDGYSLILGDLVQVGTNSPVRITAVNYAANTLTVTPSISWSTGQGVSLPYSGARPDMGAFEKTSTTPTATRLAFTAQPQSTRVGTALTPVVVEVRTAAGARDTTSTAPVTLTLSGGPGFFPGTSALQTQTFAVSKAGRYVQLITLADANGSGSASAAEITILNVGTPILQSGMSVVSVSSQEATACCGGPRLATHALDGNASTYWYTQYTGGKLGPPYTLILDLGASYPVNGWTYLPHQLADPDGHVTQYTFSVSTDGTTWGTALTDAGLTGTLTQNAVAGVVSFPGLAFATPATGYQVTASALGLTPDTSVPFSIFPLSGGALPIPTNFRIVTQ